MLAERQISYEGRIISFPINQDKKEISIGKSTKMWCLKSEDEIMKVYNVFKHKADNSATENKYTINLRNLTMFVCAINIGLRGGDFCNLKWSDIYDESWNIKEKGEYVPEKTKKCHKHIDLYWNADFIFAINQWYEWKIYSSHINLNDYIFTSQKGVKMTEKAWYSIMEKTRREAGITQKIGTHGLRKTMANRYIKCFDDKAQALMEVSSMFGHSDLRITERYACLEDEHIRENKEKTAFIFS